MSSCLASTSCKQTPKCVLPLSSYVWNVKTARAAWELLHTDEGQNGAIQRWRDLGFPTQTTRKPDSAKLFFRDISTLKISILPRVPRIRASHDVKGSDVNGRPVGLGWVSQHCVRKFKSASVLVLSFVLFVFCRPRSQSPSSSPRLGPGLVDFCLKVTAVLRVTGGAMVVESLSTASRVAQFRRRLFSVARRVIPNLFVDKVYRFTLELQMERGDAYKSIPKCNQECQRVHVQRTTMLLLYDGQVRLERDCCIWEWSSRMVLQCRALLP